MQLEFRHKTQCSDAANTSRSHGSSANSKGGILALKMVVLRIEREASAVLTSPGSRPPDGPGKLLFLAEENSHEKNWRTLAGNGCACVRSTDAGTRKSERRGNATDP